MVEEPNSSEQVVEAPRTEADETRVTLVERLETLEQGIKDKWESATTSLGETVENVQETVKSTMHSVQGAVQNTTKAMGRALDIPAHMRRHPWILLCGAVFLGVVVGLTVGRARQ